MDLESLRAEHLVETAWLAQHLDDPDLRIVDMRGYVHVETADGCQTAAYVGAYADYLEGHIPGALYLDWTRDIVDPSDPVPAQVASSEQLARVFSAAGIDSETRVVAYDNHPASQFATRLWWVLRCCGHDRVRVLNGGLAKWRAERRPLVEGAQVVEPVTFVPRWRADLRVTADQVLARLHDPGTVLVDARDEAQYAGKVRRGPRAGRIPGALHLPREALVGADGTFRPAEELQAAVHHAGVDPDKQVIAYCNGGVAATTILFALSMLGRGNAANYDGSWNEWGELYDLPIAFG